MADDFDRFCWAQRKRWSQKLAGMAARITKVRREHADSWVDSVTVGRAQGRGSKKPSLEYYDRARW